MMDKDNLVHGNTVLVPSFDPKREKNNKEYEKLKRAKKQDLANKNKRVKNKVIVLRNIAILFAVGLTLIWRYSFIYSLQNNLALVTNQVESITKENESLKVQLVRNDNVNSVEETATQKLHMVKMDNSQVAYGNLDKDNFAKTSEKSENTAQRSLIQKIKNMLF